MARALSPEKVTEIQRLKGEEQLSIRAIAKIVGCSKATVSFYARDFFDDPTRKYKTTEDMHKARIDRLAKRRRAKGIPERKPVKVIGGKRERKRYPCAVCGVNKVRRKGKTCIDCHLAQRREQGRRTAETRAKERRLRQESKSKRHQEYLLRRFGKPIIEVCPKSPNQRHHWKIDSHNYGKCIHCKVERDFAELQKKAIKKIDQADRVLNATKSRSRVMVSSGKRGQPPRFAPEPTREYNVPIESIPPPDGDDSVLDDFIRATERE